MDSANTARLVMDRKGVFRDKDIEEGTGFVNPEVYAILRATLKKESNIINLKFLGPYEDLERTHASGLWVLKSISCRVRVSPVSGEQQMYGCSVTTVAAT